MLSSRIFSSHVVSFLLFVSRPADIPDNSFPTPFPTWLPISRCNCHLREDLSIGLNARPFLCVREERPRPRFRETCEISVATSVYRLSGIYAVSGKPSSRFVFKKLFYIMIFQRLELESIDRLDWVSVEIMVAYIRTYPGNIHLLNCKYTKCFLLKGH